MKQKELFIEMQNETDKLANIKEIEDAYLLGRNTILKWLKDSKYLIKEGRKKYIKSNHIKSINQDYYIKVKPSKWYNPNLIIQYSLEHGLPSPVFELKFIRNRQFRLDIAYVEIMESIEVQGGVYQGGWHQSVSGYLKDMEKFNLAQREGWKVYQAQPKNIFNIIKNFIGRTGNETEIH